MTLQQPKAAFCGYQFPSPAQLADDAYFKLSFMLGIKKPDVARRAL
jgi:hypothetical protein